MSGPRPVADRFWPKVDKTDSCWLWTGAKNSSGYGRVRKAGRDLAAHRLAYEEMIGPIPHGLQLDHLCRVRSCVNPTHLEPVTGRTNILRSTSFAAQNAAKRACTRGHQFTSENTYLFAGRRHCRACGRIRSANYKARRCGRLS